MRKAVIGVAVAVSGLSWPLYVERFESESWPTWVIFTVAMVSTLTALVATAWPKIRRGTARRTTKPPPVEAGPLRPPKGSALYEQQRAKAREIARQFYRVRLPWWKRWLKR